MIKEELMEILETSNEFNFSTVEYKSQEDKDLYGISFEALSINDFAYVKVNGLKFKVKRIIEEFGLILFIYAGEQIELKADNIKEFKIL